MRTSKGEVTRQYLIKVSAELFNRKGYAATSMSDILEAAGYSKGALYRTFDNKDRLAVEAFRFNFGVINTAIQREMAQRSGAKEKLLALIDFYKNNHISKIIDGGCPLLNTAIEVTDIHSPLRSEVEKAFVQWNETLTQIVHIGMDNGEFSAHENPREISDFIIASIEGSVMLARIHQDLKIIQRNMKRLEALIQAL